MICTAGDAPAKLWLSVWSGAAAELAANDLPPGTALIGCLSTRSGLAPRSRSAKLHGARAASSGASAASPRRTEKPRAASSSKSLAGPPSAPGQIHRSLKGALREGARRAKSSYLSSIYGPDDRAVHPAHASRKRASRKPARSRSRGMGTIRSSSAPSGTSIGAPSRRTWNTAGVAKNASVATTPRITS